jgi:multiple sugar transport system permease protein
MTSNSIGESPYGLPVQRANAAQRRSLLNRMWRARWAYLFVLVPMVLFLTFEFYPFTQAIRYSLLKWNLAAPVGFDGLKNYSKLFQDQVFWKALWNTARYSFVVVLGSLTLSLFLAVLIHPLPKAAKTFFKMSFYLPAVASIVVVSLVWRWMYQPAFGLFNYLFSLVGLGPFRFLTSSSESLPSIMAVQIFSNPIIGIGAAMILLLAAMNSIPHDLYEAAIIDGANAWKKFRFITFPLSRPTIVFLMTIGTVETFREFTAVYLMTSSSSSNALTGGGPFYSTTTVAYYIYVNAFLTRQFGLAAAMAIVLFLIMLGLALLQFRYVDLGVEH